MLQIALFPIGVPTFHLESAEKEFQKTIKILHETDENIIVPQEMLLSISQLNSFADTVNPDLCIVQNLTFANSAYTEEILKKFSCPILLWTLREPDTVPNRLCLNSLTGAFSAANTIKYFGTPFEYVYGSPDEVAVQKKIKTFIGAVKLKKALRSLRVLQIGHTPDGFGFGRAFDNELAAKFGIKLLSVEARELMDKAKAFNDLEAEEYIEKASRKLYGLEGIERENIYGFARLYRAYEAYITKNNIGAVASRCWPDFFTSYGTPVCAVLSLMNDMGVPCACECDTLGAVSMYFAWALTGKSAFFGDPVSLNEKENTLTFWHCGMASCSLASTQTGACVGVHCNRKTGPTLEFSCKAEKQATIIRLGKDEKGNFRIFLCKGEILDKPKKYSGTNLVFKPQGSVRDIIYRAVKSGYEPHFAVAMNDISGEIRLFGEITGIPVEEY